MMPLAAITDEFSPADLERALDGMASVGMTGVELRVIGGRNILDLTDGEIDQVRDAVLKRSMQIVSIASPLLKCVLPDAPPVDTRFQQDIFGSSYTFDDQPRLAKRAFEVLERTGARIVRVFSYWRTIDPPQCFDRVVNALGELGDLAAERGVIIGLENEHACNIATGAEAARVMAALRHPHVQMIWDPANAFVSGEVAYPDGYRQLAADRIAHVHAKDCVVRDHAAEWGPLGEMGLDWKGQLDALRRDGYRGWISLETHWRGPNGDKFEASMICGRNLRDLVAQAVAPTKQSTSGRPHIA
jgi:sugar phosphate isomerase/epimerase